MTQRKIRRTNDEVSLWQLVRRFLLLQTQEQDACADAEDRAGQLQKEKEKLEDQIKVPKEKNCCHFYCNQWFVDRKILKDKDNGNN